MAYLPSDPSMAPAATRLFDGADALNELIELEAVGGQLHRIDDRFDEFVARTLDDAFQNAGHFLDAVAQLSGGGRQDALRHIAGKRDDEHRKFGEVDLVDGRLLDARGRSRLAS